MYTPKSMAGYAKNELKIPEEQYFGFFKYSLPNNITIISFINDAETRDGFEHNYGDQVKVYKTKWKANDTWNDILAEKIKSDNFGGK